MAPKDERDRETTSESPFCFLICRQRRSALVAREAEFLLVLLVVHRSRLGREVSFHGPQDMYRVIGPPVPATISNNIRPLGFVHSRIKWQNTTEKQKNFSAFILRALICLSSNRWKRAKPCSQSNVFVFTENMIETGQEKNTWVFLPSLL